MICGIDFSTKHVDVVLLDEFDVTVATHHRIVLPTPWWEAASTMYNTIRCTDAAELGGIEWGRVLFAGVERPYGQHRQSIASLHTIMGAVLASLPCPSVEVRPADMRRELGLKGNVGKDEMHRAIEGRFGPGWSVPADTWPPDALDAWAAGYAGYQMCQRAVEGMVERSLDGAP